MIGKTTLISYKKIYKIQVALLENDLITGISLLVLLGRATESSKPRQIY